MPCAAPTSGFIRRVQPLLLERYEMKFFPEGDCIAYFLLEKASGEEISRDLVLSLNRFARRIEIVRFYPELNRQPNTKYFSAALFYLLVHHFARHHDARNRHQVFVRTQPEVFDRFYSQLQDFCFRPHTRLANTIDLISAYTESDVDTSMILEHSPARDVSPFFIG
jgi:hypothetical protein